MAQIHLRGRADPIVVTNDKARRVKEIKFGDPNKKLSPCAPDTLIDLGEWSGEIRQVKAVELDRMHSFVKETTSESDLDAIEKAVGGFKKRKTVTGNTVWPVDQYLASLGVCRIGEHGETIVRDAYGYRVAIDRVDLMRERRGRREYGRKKGLEELEKVAG